MNFKEKILISLKKNSITFTKIIPVFFGIILLINLIKNSLGLDFYKNLITENIILDSFIFNAIGSIMAGNALNSYIISQDMFLSGISLFLILIFMLSWVTVGFIQLPAESLLLSKRFAITRNIIAFLSNFLVALIVIVIYEVI